MIYNAARKNDPVALKAFDVTGKILGQKLADSVAHTSPEAVFLLADYQNQAIIFSTPTKKYMEESVMGTFRNKVKILPSQLTDKNAAVMGSSALIWKELG
jgi:glucokinase